jgi:DNA-binding transcriptional MerR regulator
MLQHNVWTGCGRNLSSPFLVTAARLEPDIGVRGKALHATATGDQMRIGELAEQSGVSVRSLRYYEEQALLYSSRSERGQRLYGSTAVARVRLIQQLYAAGLSSRTLRELLPCIEQPVEQYAPALLGRLTDERDRIGARIAELQQTRDRLDLVIASAGHAARCSG